MTREEAIEFIAQSVKSDVDMALVADAIKAIEAEPCEDAISRKAVLDYIYNDLGLGDEENGKDVERQMELESSYRYVKTLPSITPQPKTGRWIKVTHGRGGHECDICHEYAPSYQSGNEYLTKYCPNCGAKMVEPQESEEKE